MDFRGSGLPLSGTAFNDVIARLDIGAPELWAVLTVETSGFGFLPDRRPRILFERHVFHRLTDGRFTRTHPTISSSSPGGYNGGAAEYARLDEAIGLDREAALASTSWGIGQVMGYHASEAGFNSVADMVTAMVTSEDAQLLAMARFLQQRQLQVALQQHAWATFACGYNGTGFRTNGYDTKLAYAYARCWVTPPNLGVRSAQVALLYLGFDPGPVDGVLGPATRRAVTEFERSRAKPASGELSQATSAALLHRAFPGSASAAS